MNDHTPPLNKEKSNEESKDNSVTSDRENETVAGTVKVYTTTSKTGTVRAQINVKGNLAPYFRDLFEQGEELFLTIRTSNREMTLEPMSNLLKKK